MERWNLHRRLALKVVRATGTRPTTVVAYLNAAFVLLISVYAYFLLPLAGL